MKALPFDANRGKKRILLYTSAFLLPVFMFFGICLLLGRAPFGSESILDMDMPTQYVYFFSYISDILFDKSDLFYTFSKSLGGELISLLAYYLLSPLNIVFALVEKADIPLAATFVIAAKLGLCGLTGALMLAEMAKGEKYSILIFSTAYAMMSYNMTYFCNVMWLDAVYLLPLIIMGMERLIQGRSPAMYVISLGLCILVNYYTGYMVCIFCLGYFIYRFIVLLSEKNAGVVMLRRFALGSLLAGGLAAVVLVPTLLSLGGTKAGFNSELFLLRPMCSPRALLQKFFTNSVAQMIDYGAPNIYCGLLTGVMALTYFANKRIRLKERVISALFLAALFASVCIRASYLVWHGFNVPADFPYRNTFILSFMLIYLAWESFTRLDGLDIRRIALIGAVIAALIIYAAPLREGALPRAGVIADIILYAVIILLICLCVRKAPARPAILLLALIQFIILFENGAYLRANTPSKGALDIDNFAASAEIGEATAEYIENYDNGIYRIVDRAAGKNAPMQFGYKGISHFSSTEKQATKEFIKSLGYLSFEKIWVSCGSFSTSAADSLLGIKYIIANDGVANDYAHLSTVSGKGIYENTQALDLCFGADSSAAATTLDSDDPFENINRAYSAVLGRKTEPLAMQADIDISLVNLTKSDFSNGYFYTREDASKEAYISYRFTAESDAPLYFYSSITDNATDMSELYTAEYTVNGERCGTYGGAYELEAKYLGRFKAGDEVELRLIPASDGYIQRGAYFYYENEHALSEAITEIRGKLTSSSLVEESSSHLIWEGSTDEEDAILLFTIPHDAGWQAYLDGERVDILSALGALSAVELPRGTHTLELKYVPPGLYAGIIISACSAAALAAWLCLRKRQCAK